MEIKLFGKKLFEINKRTGIDLLINSSSNSDESQSKFLYDFYKGGNNTDFVSQYVEVVKISNDTKKKLESRKKPLKEQIKITPKGIYELKMLNDLTFKLNTEEEYVDKQINDFKDKLSLIKSEEYDMRRGVEEIRSVVMRLENRKKYPQFKNVFEEFPYTTTTKISELTKIHNHLQLGQIAQFLADMPNEAIEVMKKYSNATESICNKQAVFYIIADKKDFQKSNTRRDPILLAQSPFGHFWQILGAWDKEMLLIEEL